MFKQKLNLNQKFVIWGYPLNSHTHSYIHYGFFKTLKSLGYNVEWFDDIEIDGDFENCIFITEANCSKNIPIVKSSKYFIHNIEDLFVDQTKYDHEHIYNLLVYHEEYNWNDSVKYNGDNSWYNPSTKSLVIFWATDLLPEEIDNMEPVLYDDTKNSNNFIGTIQGNELVNFAHISANNGKDFNNYGGYTGYCGNDSQFFELDRSIEYIKNSYLSFDIREEQHLRNGYVSCRNFKNISYGCWTGTNSLKVNKLFEGRMTINSNLNLLYSSLEEDTRKVTINQLRDNMDYIKNNHTYINRINSMISIL
jgi:hypothetical protein